MIKTTEQNSSEFKYKGFLQKQCIEVFRLSKKKSLPLACPESFDKLRINFVEGMGEVRWG